MSVVAAADALAALVERRTGEPRAVRALPLLDEHDRPRTRGDCIDRWAGVRPTPTCAGCRSWINETNVCVRDVVEKRGALTLDEVGEYFFLTRQRIRQIEQNALRRLKIECEKRGLSLADLLPAEQPEDEER